MAFWPQHKLSGNSPPSPNEKNSAGCTLCNLTFDTWEQLIIELKKDGYGDCFYCPRCGRELLQKSN